MGLRKSFTKRQVRLPIGDIPAFFRGGLGGNVESDSDLEFGEAVTALVALTGRPENDPVLRVVLAQLEDAKASLLSEACTLGIVPYAVHMHGVVTSGSVGSRTRRSLASREPPPRLWIIGIWRGRAVNGRRSIPGPASSALPVSAG